MWLRTDERQRPTALVTGGSVGLGFAMARLLVREDFDVFICARTAADLETARRAEPGLHAIQADVSLAPDRQRLFREIEAASGRPLDCLVNNAAIVRAHDYLNPYTLGEDRARDEIEINFAAPIEMARLYL
ncbi:MAG: acr1, partial [Phenylobacterium sp.]|nr:acr1 [Phenylobacterium sp.]